jgi:hypothetical protein
MDVRVNIAAESQAVCPVEILQYGTKKCQRGTMRIKQGDQTLEVPASITSEQEG